MKWLCVHACVCVCVHVQTFVCVCAIFTMVQHYASMIYAMLSLCVCPSVTSRYCTKMAKRRLANNATRESRDSSFLMPKISVKFQPSGGAKQVGWAKLWDFRPIYHYFSERVQDRDSYYLKDNRNLYAVCRTALFPVALSDPTCPKPPHFPHIAFHIFIVAGDKKSGRHVHYSKS